MWHEARKQEKKIRGMMVDYKRRAERRRDYYERIKQDPAQFLQVHGRPAKIHLDPAVAAAADSPATMMPWQGNHLNLIDRFDVRAHLDIIPDYISAPESPKVLTLEDRKACYERYRTLVQNDFMGVNEDKFLHQIFLEERFGPVLKPAGEEEKKKLADKKVAIGYIYEDSTAPEVPAIINPITKAFAEEEEEDDERDDLSDIDLDITVDVSELAPDQCVEMNEQSLKYGMVDDDFITYLLQDKDEADQLRLVKEIEEEKAMFSGRKSRRERRALREKKLAGRRITSPPSYAARDSPTYTPIRHSTSKSRSRSRSPPNAGKIMFITSFGDEVSDVDKKAAGAKISKDGIAKKPTKETKTSKASDIVIGPQLPQKSGNDKKSSRRSRSPLRTRKHGHSTSSSSTSNRRESDSRSRRRHSSRERSRRSRRSTSSDSSRSRSRSRRRRRSRRQSRTRRVSRSRSISSRSRSRSGSRSRNKKPAAKSKSKSKSPMKKSSSPLLPPPPVKSYYRHSLSRSGSDMSDSGDSPERKDESERSSSSSLMTKLQQLTGKAGPSTKSKLTPQERLKKKMQLALNRQYKADKRAQMEKSEKQLQERMDRAEELRDMAIKLRQRERERRHRIRGYDRGSDSDSSILRDDVISRDDDTYFSSKQHHSNASNSSGSPEREHSKTSDIRSSRWSRSRSASPRHKSPSRDHGRSSTLSRSSSYRREDSRKSPSRHTSRRTPPRRSPNNHSPRRTSPRRSPNHDSPRRNSPRRSPNHHSPRRSSPKRSPRRTSPRNSRQRSPQRSYSSRDNKRHDSHHRSPSRSPRRISHDYDNRRDRRSRTPPRQQSSKSRSSRLVDY